MVHLQQLAKKWTIQCNGTVLQYIETQDIKNWT